MAGGLVEIHPTFHTVRGHFRILGLVDVGTQCCLARLAGGDWVMLDSYTLDADTEAAVRRLTDGGKRLVAVLNLHPFHTLHCEWMHRAFPEARLFGTARHRERLPQLPWQDMLTESAEFAAQFGDSFDLSVPKGVPLVCEDEKVHFSSVLALHRESATIHVDDTLVCLPKRFPISLLPQAGRLSFHPTLKKALLPQPGAADAFVAWGRYLASAWAGAKHLAAAHDCVLTFNGSGFRERVDEALDEVSGVIEAHRSRYG